MKRLSHRRRRARAGFTLMEVLLVLVILVILGSMAGIFLRGAQKKALVNATRAQISTFETALELYQIDHNRFPEDNEGLNALRTAPSGNSTKWQGPYLKKDVPVDPWDNQYQYELPNPDTPKIWSYGPDGQDGTEDDISNLQTNTQ